MVLGSFALTKWPRLSGRDPTVTIQDGMSEITIPIEKVFWLTHMLSPSPQPSPWKGEGVLKLY
jgi:hypothetical protein